VNLFFNFFLFLSLFLRVSNLKKVKKRQESSKIKKKKEKMAEKAFTLLDQFETKVNKKTEKKMIKKEGKQLWD